MKLYYDKRLSNPTYYAQIGIRNGKKVTTKNIKKIGKHSELLKITDNPLEYSKNVINQLNEEYSNKKVSFSYTVDYSQKVKKTENDVSLPTSKNIGYFILQYIIKDLNLKSFFNEVTANKKNTYNCYDILRFLTYSRILDPKSKLEFTKTSTTFFEEPKFSYQHILRFMDILEENYDKYISHLYKNSNNVIKRDTSVLYYDCTNYYFESECEDEDYIDEVTGEIITGLRKYGISKEHRPNPIVEMGLFMDKNGIPISMCLHSGNTNEQLTTLPLEEKIIRTIDNSKFIYCADGGLGSYTIRKFNSLGGRAFIVTQSIKKLSIPLKEAVFQDIDYHLLSNNKKITIDKLKTFDKNDDKNLTLYNDFAYKIINADKAIDLGLYEEKTLKNGNIKLVKSYGTLKQKLIIIFSRKSFEYQRKIRNRQIERAKKLLSSNDPEEIKKGPNDVRRFMKRSIISSSKETKSTKDIKIKYELDYNKIKEEEKYDGFYAIATNLSDDVKDIISVADKRYKIEDCFIIMKINFDGRPVNHRLPERIKAHFMICYTSLLVYRLLENLLYEKKYNITAKNLIETLKNMCVSKTNDLDYVALYEGSKTLDALISVTGLNLDSLHNIETSLNNKIKNLLKS